MKKLLLVLAACVLVGCAKSQMLVESTSVENPQPLTRKILLIGDSQQRVHGTPLMLTSDMVDRYVTDVTKRPVQQELFSKYLMKYIIHQKEGGQDVAVVHLGDLLDLSCRHEWLKVKDLIGSKKDFVLVPGNHDGFMQGNFYSKKHLFISSWAALCDEGRFYDNQHMRDLGAPDQDCRPCANRLINTIATKPYLINEYLNLLAQDRHPSIRGCLPRTREKDDFEIEWQNDDLSGFLQKMAGLSCSDPLDFERCHGYDSYLLQLVKLPAAGPDSPPVFLMLLDTSQYSEESDLIGNEVLVRKPAGVYGDVQANQRGKALAWVDYVKKQNGFLLLAGHHPFATLNESTRSFVSELADKSGVRFYISAHTHKGSWQFDRDARIVELNLGSISDWPVHYRDLSVAQAPGRLIVKSTHRPVRTETIGQLTGVDCRSDWWAEEGSGLSIQNQEKNKILDFRMGQKAKTEATLLQYRQLLNLFPDGDTSRVSYVHATNIQCDLEDRRENIDSEQMLSKKVNEYLGGLKGAKGYRDAARLANTINDYSCRSQAQQIVMDTYKICQAVWASGTDAKLSKAATLTEAVMNLEFSDYFKTRYDKMAESEKSREIDSMVVMGAGD